MSTLLPATVTVGDGARLHLQHWACAEPARGTVVIVHGLGEHVGRYERVAARLTGWGFHVAGHDHRGHGLSTGARGALPHDEALLADLGAVLDVVRGSLPMPLVLLGHSLGGLVASRFVAAGVGDGPRPAWWRECDGLVLSSPALELGLTAWQRWQLRLSRPCLPDLPRSNGLKPEWLSHDPAVVRAYLDDPLVHDRITPRLVGAMVDAGQVVRDAAARWSLPTLLMWGGSDRCVLPAGSADFARAAPAAVVQSRVFETLFHEIFNEPASREVFQCLRAWLGRY